VEECPLDPSENFKIFQLVNTLNKGYGEKLKTCKHFQFIYKVLGCNPFPLQNPTLSILTVEGRNIFGWRTGLWSTEAKV
jgi:hypothetical protein